MLSTLLSLALVSAASPPPAAAQALAIEPLRHDDRGRPVIGASINGQGPYDMVVDTAAQSSLITEPLVRELKLVPAAQTIDVIGVTGTQPARLYPIARFSSALFDLRGGALIALANVGSTSARGIVGMDLLAARKLVFDRAAGRLSAGPSAPAEPGFVALKGQVTQNSLLSVPVLLDGARITALVDTGAAVTLANRAALHAMGWRDDDPRISAGGTISGASVGASGVRLMRVARLTIGPATLRDVKIVLAGDDAFGGDPAQPAMILGSDLLDLFDAFAVDMPRMELQIRVPARRADT